MSVKKEPENGKWMSSSYVTVSIAGLAFYKLKVMQIELENIYLVAF